MSASATECSICTHPEQAAIDLALAGGTSLRDTAGQFGVSRSSLSRHKTNHGTADGVLDRAETAAGGRPAGAARTLDLVDVHGELSSLYDRLSRALAYAEKRPARSTGLANVAREQRAVLEALSRLQADPAFLDAQKEAHWEQELASDSARRMFRLVEALLGAFFKDPNAGKQARELLAGMLRSDVDGQVELDRIASGWWEAWRERHLEREVESRVSARVDEAVRSARAEWEREARERDVRARERALPSAQQRPELPAGSSRVVEPDEVLSPVRPAGRCDPRFVTGDHLRGLGWRV